MEGDIFEFIDNYGVGFPELMTLALHLSDLYHGLAGEPMRFSSAEYYRYGEEHHDPGRCRLADLVRKEDVRKALRDHAPAGGEEGLMREVEAIYPSTLFGGYAPKVLVFEYLFNEHLRHDHR